MTIKEWCRLRHHSMSTNYYRQKQVMQALKERHAPVESNETVQYSALPLPFRSARDFLKILLFVCTYNTGYRPLIALSQGFDAFAVASNYANAKQMISPLDLSSNPRKLQSNKEPCDVI